MRCDIIIPAFNAGKYIGKSIESALIQGGVENIIVVDDGSTDNTVQIVETFKEVTLLRQDNQGQSVARNNGLKLAKADTVIFLDADDELLPDAVSIHHRALEEHPDAVMVFGSNFRTDAAGNIIAVNKQPFLVASTPYEVAMSVGAVPSQCLYRLKPLVDVGGFDSNIRYSEDFDLNVRVSILGCIVCHGEFVMNYRSHELQATKDTSDILSSQVRIINRHFGPGGQSEDAQFLKRAKRKWLLFHSRNIPAEIIRGIKGKKPHKVMRAFQEIINGAPYTFVGVFQGILRKIRSTK